MKPDRIESLVSWMWTGALLIAAGLFFLIRGWFLTEAGIPRVNYRGTLLDPQIALGGAILLLILGVVLVACAVISKLRQR